MQRLLSRLAAFSNLFVKHDAINASPQSGLGLGVHGTLFVKPQFVLHICVLAVLDTLEE